MQRMFNPDRGEMILVYLGRSFLWSINDSVTIHIATRRQYPNSRIPSIGILAAEPVPPIAAVIIEEKSVSSGHGQA